MTINAQVLFNAFDTTENLLHTHALPVEGFAAVKAIFEDKRHTADAKIMVYGVYNAGKSTLINALLGQEAAATNDIPETSKVDSYRWGRFDILDTPGIDAPIEHEQVTHQELLKADAVIFVVNPIGAAEEVTTLAALVSLLAEGKQVFLVFNAKSEISEEEFLLLKEKTLSRLQEQAGKRNLHNILKDIPIVKVNAKRALQAKLKNNPKLLAASDFDKLETQLEDFLNRISSDDIYGRLKMALLDFLNQTASMLSTRSQKELVKKYDHLLSHLEGNKVKLKKNLAVEINNSCDIVGNNVRRILRRSLLDEQNVTETKLQTEIQELFESQANTVAAFLETEIAYLIQKVREDIEDLQAAIPEIETPLSGSIEIRDVNGQPTEVLLDSTSITNSTLTAEQLTAAVDTLTKVAKPEHIVAGLKLVKEYLPSLMKGIGIKTMGKWATMVTGKLPYIGTAITVVSSLIDIFSDDKETKLLQSQVAEAKRARERAEKQIEDMVIEITAQFHKQISSAMEQSVHEFFEQITGQVKSLRQSFSEEEQNNSALLGQVAELQQQVELA